MGPTGLLPASDDPTLGRITFAELVDVFAEQAAGRCSTAASTCSSSRRCRTSSRPRRPIFGARGRSRPRAAPCRSRSPSRCCPTAGRCCSAPTSTPRSTTLEALRVDVIGLNCSTGPEDMRDAIRFLGEHAPDAGPLHPERRPAAAGPRTARRSSPSRPSRWPTTLGEFVERYGVGDRRRLLRHDARAHRRDPRARGSAGRHPARPRPRPAPRPPSARDDRRDAARAGPAADARRRARQQPGLAQGQGAAARRRLRRPRAGRRGPGRGRRARARRLRRAHRARRRGRADARDGQAHQPRGPGAASRSTRPSPTSSARRSSRSRAGRSSTR